MPLLSSDFEQLMIDSDASSECDLNHRDLDSADLERLMDYLPRHPKITCLNLAGNLLGNDGIRALLKATTITHLNLMGNNLSDQALDVLSQLKQLIFLNLNMNKVGDKGALALGDLPKLQQLLLNGNAM